jgi:hypothetical protein
MPLNVGRGTAMRRVLSIFAALACFLALALAAPPALSQVVPGWVSSPPTRNAASAQSNESVTLSGYVLVPGQTVTIWAVDQNTGDRVFLSTTQASKSGKSYLVSPHGQSPGFFPPHVQSYTLYPWRYETGVLAANYWAPQQLAADIAASQGHLELFASVRGWCSFIRGRFPCREFLPTFSALALEFMPLLPHDSTDPAEGVALNSDGGDSTVLFDQYGVGGGPASWTTVAGMITNPPSVAWSVGSYTVDGGKNIYALICAPNTPGQYPMVVYNHGGINAGPGNPDTGSLHGNVTNGWTSPPAGSAAGSADDLGQCVDWAKRGWIFAMSSYRAETIYISSGNSTNSWTSDAPNGGSEFCLGEVTDVMALVDLLVHHIDTIMLGNPTQKIPINAWNGQLFMYGYSHGGCITYRAVEQGAPVNAFAVIEGFTDVNLNYLNGLVYCSLDPSTCTTSQGVYDPTGFAAVGGHAFDGYKILYYPDASSGGMLGQIETYPGVMGYNWRSAHYFASRGDLGIRKFDSMPILILHGDIDYFNPVPLDEPLEFAPDINATEIFVGPSGFPFCTAPSTVPNPPQPNCIPTSETCITGTVGAPIVDPTTHEPLPGVPSSCQVNFTLAVPTNWNSCLGAGPANFGSTSCDVIPLQRHSLVVYHNMDHFNGGLGIQKQFNSFVQQNFGTAPGCNGVPTSTGPIPCNN